MEKMRKLLNEYLKELSQFDPEIQFGDKGTPIYKWFDCYWTDKDRFPLYLVIENEIAGFALVRELGNMSYEIAEFYVCPNFRKDNNAIWFATEITNLFDGEFAFSTRFTNHRAIRFWSKFVSQFEDNCFSDDDSWRKWTIRKNNFKNHTLHLNPVYFDLIKSNQKTLEGRLNTKKRQNFSIGDTITFYKEPENEENFDAIILDRYDFENFDEMAEVLNKDDLGFQNSSKDEMKKVYRTIYPLEDETKYGVVVFKIKVI